MRHLPRTITFVLLLAASAHTASAQKPAPAPGGRAQLTWIGHAAFEVVSRGGTRLSIDPWHLENDRAPAAYKDLTRYLRERPTAILVTHAHADHADDTPALAKLTGAKVAGPAEHLRAMKIPDAQ